jgi:hypothetical protein
LSNPIFLNKAISFFDAAYVFLYIPITCWVVVEFAIDSVKLKLVGRAKRELSCPTITGPEFS